ncbi:MAG: YesL family protein [Saccharofermentanales bacterium]
MAGIFGFFDYNKEGPGVYLNEPPKGPFKTFFSVIGRKFWKIVSVNIIYILISLPILALAFIIGIYVFPTIIPFLQIEVLEKLFTADKTASGVSGVSQAVSQISQAVSQAASQAASTVSKAASAVSDPAIVLTPKETAAVLFLQLNLALSMMVVGLQLVVLGPAQAGITYVLRNFSREEHAFVWADFKDHAKKNWKQSAITSIISILAFIIMSVNFTYYSSSQFSGNGFLSGILTGLVVILFGLFTMMQMYIYPMMVTFKLSLRQLYKNSFLLTIAKLPSNIGIFIISIIITMVIPLSAILIIGPTGTVFSIFYYIFICFGLNLLVTNFHVYRQLKKYMIDPTLEEERKAKEAAGLEEDTEKPIFQDVDITDKDIDKGKK